MKKWKRNNCTCKPWGNSKAVAMSIDSKKTIVKTDVHTITIFEIKRSLYNDFHSPSFEIVGTIYE